MSHLGALTWETHQKCGPLRSSVGPHWDHGAHCRAVLPPGAPSRVGSEQLGGQGRRAGREVGIVKPASAYVAALPNHRVQGEGRGGVRGRAPVGH